MEGQGPRLVPPAPSLVSLIGSGRNTLQMSSSNVKWTEGGRSMGFNWGGRAEERDQGGLRGFGFLWKVVITK